MPHRRDKHVERLAIGFERASEVQRGSVVGARSHVLEEINPAGNVAPGKDVNAAIAVDVGRRQNRVVVGLVNVLNLRNGLMW